jgi:predicted TIM-barrel fold metal-dependent hydrolase
MTAISRRHLVLAAAAVALQREAGAADPTCYSHPGIGDSNSPLTIDVHAHIFNGSDLQVKEFIRQVDQDGKSELHGLATGLGGAFLQRIAWGSAPTAQAEAQELRSLRNCKANDTFDQKTALAKSSDYERGRAALTTALASYKQDQGPGNALGGGGGKSLPFGVESAIKELPATYDKYVLDKEKQIGTLGSHPSIRGYIDFVLHNFNRRFTNATDYFDIYSKNSARKIDLLVASMVDYDYWLAKGAPTKSPLKDQVAAMKEISITSEGRVHGFVCFCPFRELATTDATGEGDAMRTVRLAIEESGFIGVKLYPPMGFAAYGNTGLDVWRNKNLPPSSTDADFGAKLDQAMTRLFEYCLANDVPVMAHTNASNTPHKEFKELTGSDYWGKALQRFPGLRISFGHFGDTDMEDNLEKRPASFVALMGRGAGNPGRNTYADSGYFSGVLQDANALRPVLAKLYAQSADKILVERLMYGTDWEMILAQAHSDGYLAKFVSMMAKLEQEGGFNAPGRSLSDAFFGYNAVEFLGLRSGGNRQRLDKFYANNSMSAPDWIEKLK